MPAACNQAPGHACTAPNPNIASQAMLLSCSNRQDSPRRPLAKVRFRLDFEPFGLPLFAGGRPLPEARTTT